MLENITGSGLGNFPNLKELHCQYCEKLEDDHLIRLLRSSDKLELLDVRWCEKITNSVINVAIEVTKNRPNNVALEMYIRFKAVKLKEINGKSSLLYLLDHK